MGENIKLSEQRFMRNKKKDQDIHSEKRYQFIREQVRPQKRELVISYLKRLGVTVLFACVFGGIAGGIIVAMQNRLVQPKKEVVEVSTYSSAPEQTSEPSVKKSKKTEEKVLSISNLYKLTRKMAAVGTRMDSALVGVQAKKNAKNWFDQNQTARRMAYGLLFYETTSYYDVLTTSDIVQEQESVNIQLVDDTMIEGIILGSDTQLNIAVVRIKKDDIKPALRKQMTVAELEDGLGLSSGTNVIAIGSPNGVLHSVISGTITNDSIQASLIDGEVQLYTTDMSYSSVGNGIVLDTDGRVVGVITTEFGEETGTTALSFIKMSHVKTQIGMLQKRKTTPYLGVEGKSFGVSVAKAHHLAMGAYLTEVYFGSPAYKAGMRVADVITEIDGETVSGMWDVYRNLMRHASDDKITYTISRKSGNKKVKKKIKVTLG